MSSSKSYIHTFVSFNICWSRRATGEFDDYSLLARIHKVCKFLHTENADIMFLQEVPTGYKGIFEEEFDGYGWHWQNHPDRSSRCWLAIAVKKAAGIERLTSKKICDMDRPFGDWKDYLLDSEVQVLEGIQYMFVNVHLPMDKSRRSELQKRLADGIAHIRGRRWVVLWGDMNTFADDGGRDEIAQLSSSSGLAHVKVAGDVSFVAYPYDVFDAPTDNIPLDNGFVSDKVRVTKQEFVCYVPDCMFTKDERVWWCSDHFATRATLEFVE